MFEALLPSCAVTVSADADASPAPLPPIEAVLVARAVASRRREFALGRMCARAALERCGVPVEGIGAGERGEPLWPAPMVGSITHCRGLVAAAVARAADLRGVGIDAEPAQELKPELLAKVCTASELRWGRGLVGDLPWGKLVFSAKEAVYKCVFPTARALLDFRDVTLRVDADGRFRAESTRCDVSAVRGRWAVNASFVLTAAIWHR